MKKIYWLLLLLISSSFFVLPAQATNTYYSEFASASSEAFGQLDADADLDLVGTDFTIEFWLNISSTDLHIITKYNDSTSNRQWSFQAIPDGADGYKMLSQLCGDGACSVGTRQLLYSEGGLTLDAWEHLAFTFDQDGNSVWYINGASSTSANTNVTLWNGNANFCINGIRTCSTYNWSGEIDDVRIWNDVRTAEEIADNYNCDLTNTTDLRNWWKFDGQDGSDSKGTVDLIEYNTPTFDNTSLPFTDNCAIPEEPEETGSTTPYYVDDIIPTNQLGVITIKELIYNASNTLTGYSYSYLYSPFLVWLIIAIPFLFVAGRLLLELIIRMRK